MLGHELRNPLAPMVTAIELLKTEKPDACSARLLAVLERQASHMRRLIDDVLDISRIRRGAITLERRRIDLAGVVRDALEMVSPALDRQRHRLIVDVPASTLFVDGDANRLTQIVTNLLTNAAKYSEPERQISIAGTISGGMVQIAVRDQGVGIAPEMLSGLFQPFVQGPRALARSEGGLGLGLSIASAFASLHGGSLSATSEGAGLGSEFVLMLPASDLPESRPLSSDEPAPLRAPSNFGTVLVVDDNRDAADLLSEGLRAHGYAVVTAYDAAAALALVGDEPPAAALIDIGLPVMDGYDLARELRGRFSAEQMHLVAISGYGQETDRATARAAGFDAHLVKPVDLSTVHETLVEGARGDRS
jgi:CheY-like chemotaxis protein